MKKSINLWAFPYPAADDPRAVPAARQGRRLRRDRAELRPRKRSVAEGRARSEFQRSAAWPSRIGIAISGVCSFLFWPYPLTSNDAAKRARGLELARPDGRTRADDLGTENLLVVPGAVHIPWRDDHEPVPNDVCDRRAREAVARLVRPPRSSEVSLNIENIFFNGYLMTPVEMNAFVDSFKSRQVRVHFDTGNIMLFQFPEHWMPILGKRIKNTHFKEFTKKGTDHSLESFRPLLDGTTNWPAVMEALERIGYRGYLHVRVLPSRTALSRRRWSTRRRTRWTGCSAARSNRICWRLIHRHPRPRCDRREVPEAETLCRFRMRSRGLHQSATRVACGRARRCRRKPG